MTLRVRCISLEWLSRSKECRWERKDCKGSMHRVHPLLNCAPGMAIKGQETSFDGVERLTYRTTIVRRSRDPKPEERSDWVGIG